MSFKIERPESNVSITKIVLNNVTDDISLKSLFTIKDVKPPERDSDVTTKKYVDDHHNHILGNFVSLTGVKKDLNMDNHKIKNLKEPSELSDAATKAYVDDKNNFLVGNFLSLKGGVLEKLSMNGSIIKDVGNPLDPSDVATKKYVDDTINSSTIVLHSISQADVGNTRSFFFYPGVALPKCVINKICVVNDNVNNFDIIMNKSTRIDSVVAKKSKIIEKAQLQGSMYVDVSIAIDEPSVVYFESVFLSKVASLTLHISISA